MKILIAVLVVLLPLGATQAQAKKKEPSALEKVLKTMFPSTKPKVEPQKKKRYATPKKRSQPVTRQNVHFMVEPQWMARYWEEEAQWDYYIPEDDQIKFKDGHYIVPFVVYRHYEDMANTPDRVSSSATDGG